ncbi:MAG: TM0996/MTH895 family glutaredoxin-like protein [Candidatus Eisenbacteria bacterium]|nr:TM0996/MTH895 family glutaredoxin-like protein [Candidatus Eisenbacteria bacterium]
MKVQVLGTGCPKCRQLEQNARTAARQLGVECEVEKITNLKDIMTYGIAMTPGLAIDGKVVSSGKVLPVEEIVSLLASAEEK